MLKYALLKYNTTTCIEIKIKTMFIKSINETIFIMGACELFF